MMNIINLIAVIMVAAIFAYVFYRVAANRKRLPTSKGRAGGGKGGKGRRRQK